MVARWAEIIREHDWQLVALLIGAVCLPRGVIYLWPAAFLVADIYGPFVALAPAQVWGAALIIGGALSMGGVYSDWPSATRAGQLACSTVLGFHASVFALTGVWPGALIMAVLSFGAGIVFLRARGD